MTPLKIVVIGAGPGGYVAAVRAAALGADVTVVEKEHLGGTCLNWGCIPSKIMKNSADLYLKLSKAEALGIDVDGTVSPNMTALMQRKSKVLESQRKGITGLLKSSRVKVVYGQAVVKERKSVQVCHADNTVSTLVYDKLIIAAGTTPMNVSDFPFDHDRVLSSNDILALNHVPESLVIVGGGVIGCEFAFIFSALGTKVTVVEAMSRILPLPSVDADISKNLLREMKKRKITVLCDTIVKSCEKKDTGLIVHLDTSPFTDNPNSKKLKTNSIETRNMAVCIGRSSTTPDLGLDNIGVKTDKQGWIEVNETLETNVKGIFAVGDILGPDRVMLAHVASHEGIIAAQNTCGKDSTMAYEVIPSAIFTMPEIGTVGLSEDQARNRGLNPKSHTMNFRTLGKAQAIDEIAGMVKMIVEEDTQKILGVHMIGAHATDLIAEAALAIQQGMTASQVAQTIHAHPTLAEIMGEVSMKACGMAIHGEK